MDVLLADVGNCLRDAYLFLWHPCRSFRELRTGWTKLKSSASSSATAAQIAVITPNNVIMSVTGLRLAGDKFLDRFWR